MKRLLHQPTLRLKASADDGGTYAYVQALRELFGLDTEKLSAFEAPQSERPTAADDADAPAAEVTSIRSRRRQRNAEAAADRHARQRAGARAGERGRRPRCARRTGVETEIVPITTSGDTGRPRRATSPGS